LLFQGSESPQDMSRAARQTENEAGNPYRKAGRILENEEEGIISKVDLDRKLKIVDDEAEVNRHPLDEVVETPMPTGSG
jgi:hypothetical protein